MKMKTDWRHLDDVRRVAAYAEEKPADPEIDCRVSANVGDLVAVALAAAGCYAIRLGGATACETDYLAASGATFPAHVTYEQMVDFNRQTLKPDMDESAEHERYAQIALFFGRGA
jgi:hypothetical protein